MGLFGWALVHNAFDSRQEKLILFLSSDKPIMMQEDIDSIKQLAENMKLDFMVKADSLGLPEEIRTLPSIYFQNEQGRSQFYGRYSSMSRLRNFVRTSKMVHHKDAGSQKQNVLVWQDGKADIIAPIKITKLEGRQPIGFDSLQFVHSAHQAIASGMQKFRLLQEHEIDKKTKGFYFNIYPYLDEQDKLSICYEVFSQYNCVRPISRELEPVIPPFAWQDRAAGFAEIGSMIENDILGHIEHSEIGDAFRIVPNDAKTVSWEQLGLAIEAAEAETEDTAATIGTIGRKWTVEPREHLDEPIIIFSFLSPVDNYAGEVKALEGELQLSEELSLAGAVGKFTVSIADVTMGTDEFDDAVQNKMLKKSLYPEAQFEFTQIKGNLGGLQDGAYQKLNVFGTFTMLGISIPIEVESRIGLVNEGGVTKMDVSCNFELPLFEEFRVKGPDGPSPAKDILQFYMNFKLVESF